MHCQHLGSTCLGPANKLQFFQYPNFANLITLWFFKVPAKNLSCVFDGFCMFLGVLKDDGFEMNCPKWWFNLAMDQWNICRFTHEKNSKWFFMSIQIIQFIDSDVFVGCLSLLDSNWEQQRYAEVLRLLREAEQSGKWPACSKATVGLKLGMPTPPRPKKLGKLYYVNHWICFFPLNFQTYYSHFDSRNGALKTTDFCCSPIFVHIEGFAATGPDGQWKSGRAGKRWSNSHQKALMGLSQLDQCPLRWRQGHDLWGTSI